eukprot:TRINITY_DN9753_c0_g1_i1.p1 TRINITY_DN9753_c0_g1~~TRINITY_DN9753_c0_g1_i1.p1  ORF type:complete len:352 (-),score=108.73 TRINITY_DN9753_c0_g1_i1:23-1078(-)
MSKGVDFSGMFSNKAFLSKKSGEKYEEIIEKKIQEKTKKQKKKTKKPKKKIYISSSSESEKDIQESIPDHTDTEDDLLDDKYTEEGESSSVDVEVFGEISVRKRKRDDDEERGGKKKRKLSNGDPLNLHEGYKSIRVDDIEAIDDVDLLRKEISSLLKGDLVLDDFLDEMDEPVVEKVEPIITVFVGGIPHDTPPKDVRQFFKKCGVIKNFRVLGRYSEDRETYVCFFDFRGEKAAEKAVSMNGTTFNNKILEIRLATDTRPSKNQKKKNVINTTLVVKNVNFNSNEKAIRKLFNKYGLVKNVRIPLDYNTGEPKGFCFITYSNMKGVRAALAEENWELDGNYLTVELSNN